MKHVTFSNLKVVTNNCNMSEPLLIALSVQRCDKHVVFDLVTSIHISSDHQASNSLLRLVGELWNNVLNVGPFL